MTISCNLSYSNKEGLNLLGGYECNVKGDFSFEPVKNQNVFDQNDIRRNLNFHTMIAVGQDWFLLLLGLD